MLRCPGGGNCQVLKSRGWGIYYILAKKIQIPGVLPGGEMVTAGIDPCIILTTGIYKLVINYKEI
jgi:hypothetical protein